MKFEREYHDNSGQWFRAYGNEQGEFALNGLMERREKPASMIWRLQRAIVSLAGTDSSRTPNSTLFMGRNFTDFAFTRSVKEAQEHCGSRKNYDRMEEDPNRYLLTDQEKGYIPGLDFFFMATTSENGWPYVQYRGGPKGFL